MNENHPIREHELMMTRRQLFGRAALGLGTAAMANLLGSDLGAMVRGARVPGAGGAGSMSGMHHGARAKRVIYLFMSGVPSH
ncbi:MAG: sulfatase, partial [Deltaproteobacteria bacterium]|nr:sulfatase [Deltaproteobacteria bacterium]